MPSLSSTADEYLRRSQKPQRSYNKGTYPITRKDRIKLDFWFTRHLQFPPESSSDDDESEEMGVLPSFPYKDVPIYGDTTDIPTLNVHDVWGCFLTPENVSARIGTDGLRYHAWVAAKEVVEQYPQCRNETLSYMKLALRLFFFRLGLALLDSFPGPVVLFLDPRLYANKTAMVSEARDLIALFDKADVRRWRVIITLPATEAGIRAAHELTHEYSICIHLSMVTSLMHASACVESGATMLSMNIGPIMSWFEKKDGNEARYTVAPSHPGIKIVQSTINYIRHHALNTSLLAVDIHNLSDLKQLNGIDGVALDQQQLNEIPRHEVTTWLPEFMNEEYEFSPAYLRACEAEYPPDFLSRKSGGLTAAFSAEDRSLMSSVLYMRIGQSKVFMEHIEDVIRKELWRHIDVDAFDLQPILHRRKTMEVVVDDEKSVPGSQMLRRRSSQKTIKPSLRVKSKTCSRSSLERQRRVEEMGCPSNNCQL